MLARICLTYLSFTKFDEMWRSSFDMQNFFDAVHLESKIAEYTFLDTASKFWTTHYRKADNIIT